MTVIIAQPVKILNSTETINKYSSAAAICNSTNKIVPLLILSDERKLFN